MFDVGTLLEDAETKTAALERVEELEENLTTVRQTSVKREKTRLDRQVDTGETDRWTEVRQKGRQK